VAIFVLVGVVLFVIRLIRGPDRDSEYSPRSASGSSSKSRSRAETDVHDFTEDRDDSIGFDLDVDFPPTLGTRTSRRFELGLREDDEAEHSRLMAESDERTARAEAVRGVREQIERLNGALLQGAEDSGPRFRVDEDGNIQERT